MSWIVEGRCICTSTGSISVKHNWPQQNRTGSIISCTGRSRTWFFRGRICASSTDLRCLLHSRFSIALDCRLALLGWIESPDCQTQCNCRRKAIPCCWIIPPCLYTQPRVFGSNSHNSRTDCGHGLLHHLNCIPQLFMDRWANLAWSARRRIQTEEYTSSQKVSFQCQHRVRK